MAVLEWLPRPVVPDTQFACSITAHDGGEGAATMAPRLLASSDRVECDGEPIALPAPAKAVAKFKTTATATGLSAGQNAGICSHICMVAHRNRAMGMESVSGTT